MHYSIRRNRSACGSVPAVGKRVAEAVPYSPVPVIVTDCVAPTTSRLLSVKTSDAARVPAAEGVKVTVTVQVALAASDVVQVVPAVDNEKSAALAPVS